MLNESISGGLFGRGFEKGEIGSVIEVKEPWFSDAIVIVAFDGGRTTELKESQIARLQKPAVHLTERVADGRVESMVTQGPS